jgi:uncharacterized membrane protein
MPIGKSRLEAFSDGVIAIIITIMVLELKAPHSATPGALYPLLPALVAYLLSFIYVGIYWNNHHHLFQAARGVTGATLWANLHLLFWLSLIPFVTSWMGETRFATWPAVAYGLVLLMAASAWTLLARTLIRAHGPGSLLSAAIGRGRKERRSLALYILGIALALLGLWLEPPTGDHDRAHWTGMAGCAAYALVAVLWFIPDRRLAAAIASPGQ